VLNIVNAGNSAYAEGWAGYRVVASYDSVYFAPYSYERHQDFLHRVQLEASCQLPVLGETLDGREVSVLKIGQAGEVTRVGWLTARQHPGETMAEWFMEGFIDRLIDKADGVARSLLDHAVFYFVPNMNPDG
jgi:murein tripeptide amidase MpaA